MKIRKMRIIRGMKIYEDGVFFKKNIIELKYDEIYLKPLKKSFATKRLIRTK